MDELPDPNHDAWFCGFDFNFALREKAGLSRTRFFRLPPVAADDPATGAFIIIDKVTMQATL